MKQFIKHLGGGKNVSAKLYNRDIRFIKWFHLFDSQISVHPLAKFLNQNWPNLFHKNL